MRRAELRRRSNSRPRRLGQAGFSLIEIVMAILLVAVMMASVMSASLTAKTSGGKMERRIVAGMSSSQLSAQLSNFVTAYWDYNAGGFIANASDIDGPMSSASCVSGTNAGACTWAWKTEGITDSACGGGSCYALQAGAHTLTNFLPAWMEAPPYNGQACYYVCGPGAANGSYTCAGQSVTAPCVAQPGTSVGGGYSPSVSVVVNWTEP